MASEAKQRSSSAGAVAFMVAAVIFAAIAGVLLSRLLGAKYADEPLGPVVVAAGDIPAGEPLKANRLRVANWPVSSIPRGAYPAVAAVLKSDAVPLVPLVEGAAVLASQLSEPRSGMGVAAKLPPGQRAMSLYTSTPVATARLLYPGARVDVLATLGASGRGSVRTKIFLQNVLILSVGASIDPISDYGESAEGGQLLQPNTSSRSEERDRKVVTVAVTPNEAEQLVLAGRQGQLDLILRSPKDGSTVATRGATPAQLFGAEKRARKQPESETDLDLPY